MMMRKDKVAERIASNARANAAVAEANAGANARVADAAAQEWRGRHGCEVV